MNKINPTELKMNDSEIAIVKRKVTKSKIFMIIFIAFIAIWIWLFNDPESSYFFLTSSISTIFVILFLFAIYLYLKKLLATQKDIKEKIKIIDEFNVIDKYIDRSSRSMSYYIVFNSKVLKKYEVNKNVYDVINVTDPVCIEYSKYANWILKIKHNHIDIENKQMIA